MFRQILLLSVLFLLAVPLSSALEISSYNIDFHILGSGSVHEEIVIDFSQAFSQSSANNFKAGDISEIQVSNENGDLQYVTSVASGQTTVEFTIPQGTKKLFIEFTAKDLVFENSGISQFFINFRPPGSERLFINVYLTPGSMLYRDMIFPSDAERMTDGQNIWFSWQFTNRTDQIPISIKYYRNQSDYEWIAAGLGLIFTAVIIYLIFHQRKKVRHEFFRGFSEDETRVIKILMKLGVTYQNKVEKELKFSRAKMTRIMKKLEAKGLITKEQVGRTNKIFWKKK
jgi:hypothetical protein